MRLEGQFHLHAHTLVQYLDFVRTCQLQRLTTTASASLRQFVLYCYNDTNSLQRTGSVDAYCSHLGTKAVTGCTSQYAQVPEPIASRAGPLGPSKIPRSFHFRLIARPHVKLIEAPRARHSPSTHVKNDRNTRPSARSGRGARP